MFLRLLKKLGCAWLALVLSACGILPMYSPNGALSKAPRQPLYGLKKWRLDGRLAIITPNDSWSAGIVWNHLPDSENIKLSGPLGQGAVAVKMTATEVKIDRGNGNIQISDQPETFINQQLGLYVPLPSLRYWAVGLPEPGLDFQETPDGFVQAGWLVAYLDMQPTNFGQMPQKMAVSNEHVKLKLVIDQWDLNGGKID
jgi:outer membrane lipoprotein LolB